jgi:UDP-glucose 4-epimerase
MVVNILTALHNMLLLNGQLVLFIITDSKSEFGNSEHTYVFCVSQEVNIMTILVTGGTGYIGSHTVVELQNAGYDVVVMDNLSDSSMKVLDRIEAITGKKVPFYEADIRNREDLEKIFSNEKIDAVIHFAGLKAVGESVQKPWEYYENNISGTLTLLDEMRKHNVKNIIFSSSATVYGNPAIIPITEECPKGVCTNPYGWTKHMLEQILTDIQKADNEWNVVLLRYFNPIGAHKSGTMGENPNGIPNNLMPYITQVAVGKLDHLNVFGDDYDTPDGTGVRDYIHVVDLAKGHVKALKKLEPGTGLSLYNLGTGVGYSVLDIVKNFEEANGVKIPYVIAPRRAGDIATCYSDASKAEKELGWKAENGIREMCEDSWRWQKNNPNGYED